MLLCNKNCQSAVLKRDLATPLMDSLGRWLVNVRAALMNPSADRWFSISPCWSGVSWIWAFWLHIIQACRYLCSVEFWPKHQNKACLGWTNPKNPTTSMLLPAQLVANNSKSSYPNPWLPPHRNCPLTLCPITLVSRIKAHLVLCVANSSFRVMMPHGLLVFLEQRCQGCKAVCPGGQQLSWCGSREKHWWSEAPIWHLQLQEEEDSQLRSDSWACERAAEVRNVGSGGCLIIGSRSICIQQPVWCRHGWFCGCETSQHQLHTCILHMMWICWFACRVLR